MKHEEEIVKNIKSGFIDGLIVTIVGLIGFGIVKKCIDHYKRKNYGKTKTLLSSLGFKNVIPTLNDYELSIASQLIDPSAIDVTFADIAGLDNIIESIKTEIILPLLTYPIMRQKFRHFQPPKGVLLHGPPGCGKTMIAKATAKEAGARFINLAIPTLTDKWYGESQKYALAVFTLAQKLQPCIIFVDEIDTFLRSRRITDHEVTAMMKAQFMILWDGLNSKKDECGVVVLGATNRPHDVDEAILRRMPSRFEIPKPDRRQRQQILNLLLAGESLQDDVDVEKLAESTNGFSASDLKELCRSALSAPICQRASEILELASATDKTKLSRFLADLRNVNHGDFQAVLARIDERSDLKGHDHSCSRSE
ncbi:AAA and/or Mg chelatase domain containing protein [Asbolus verrucosus]|uniref:AAA and/or Mg chelatase domain containing protein n=1 Tax=Asbolus verrucosus TaxID=1661398 RepID=A0A482W7Y1_ASBVE|nr:AAA and/or Mg chelatase domain containing protein [Asbolus verrucosus]